MDGQSRLAKDSGPSLLVFGVWGHSNSGKTRMVEQLIPPLRERGLRVGTVKHASHQLSLDVRGKDSHRHAMAGAQRVLLLGPGSASLFVHVNTQSELASWLPLFSDSVDVLLVEGFKRLAIPHVRIEVEAVEGFELQSPAGQAQPAWLVRRPAQHDGQDLHFPAEVVSRLADEIAGLVMASA